MRHYVGEAIQESSEEEDDDLDVFNNHHPKSSSSSGRNRKSMSSSSNKNPTVAASCSSNKSNGDTNQNSYTPKEGQEKSFLKKITSQPDRAAKMEALIQQLQHDSANVLTTSQASQPKKKHSIVPLEKNRNNHSQSDHYDDTSSTTRRNITTTTSSTAAVYGSHCTSAQEELTTTNLFVGNLSPLVMEQDLYDIFSQCGPLVSVKIMWPRKPSVHPTNTTTMSSNYSSSSRDHHSGFVCFTNRTSAQYAMDHYNHFELKGRRIYLNWGKAVLSTGGHDHDGQVLLSINKDGSSTTTIENYSSIDSKNQIPIPLPSTHDRYIFINSIAFQVAIYGSALEEELRRDDAYQCSPRWAFLYPFASWVSMRSKHPNYDHYNGGADDDDDNATTTQEIQSENLYYRWRVYAFAQEHISKSKSEHVEDEKYGTMDEQDSSTLLTWSTRPFQMFHDGSHFLPPTYQQVISKYNLDPGTNSEDISPTESSTGTTTTTMNISANMIQYKTTSNGTIELIDNDIVLFQDMIYNLIGSKESICQAMAFCLDRSMAAVHVSLLLKEALLDSIESGVASIDTMCARLYLISDVLYNSQQPGVKNAFQFRTCIEQMARKVFQSLGRYDANARVGRMTKNKLRNAVRAVLSAWNDWSVYVPEFLDELEALFEGKEYSLKPQQSAEITDRKNETSISDGHPRIDQDFDLMDKRVPAPASCSSIWMDVGSTGGDEKEVEVPPLYQHEDYPRKNSFMEYTHEYADLVDEELDGESLGDSEIDYDESFSVLENNQAGIATMTE